MPMVMDTSPVPTGDHEHALEIQTDCEMDISPLRPESDLTPVVPVVTPVPAMATTSSTASTSSTPHPAAKRLKVETVDTAIQRAMQIDTVLRSLQSVVLPLAELLEDLSPVKTSPRSDVSQHSSLTASVAVPTAERARSTKPAPDDAMQARKLEYAQSVLFPSRFSGEKPAEISLNGAVLHILQETLR